MFLPFPVRRFLTLLFAHWVFLFPLGGIANRDNMLSGRMTRPLNLISSARQHLTLIARFTQTLQSTSGSISVFASRLCVLSDGLESIAALQLVEME